MYVYRHVCISTFEHTCIFYNPKLPKTTHQRGWGKTQQTQHWVRSKNSTCEHTYILWSPKLPKIAHQRGGKNPNSLGQKIERKGLYNQLLTNKPNKPLKINDSYPTKQPVCICQSDHTAHGLPRQTSTNQIHPPLKSEPHMSRVNSPISDISCGYACTLSLRF